MSAAMVNCVLEINGTSKCGAPAEWRWVPGPNDPQHPNGDVTFCSRHHLAALLASHGKTGYRFEPIEQYCPVGCGAHKDPGPWHERGCARWRSAHDDDHVLAARIVKYFGDVPPEELPLMIAEDPSCLTQFVDEAWGILAKAEGRSASERSNASLIAAAPELYRVLRLLLLNVEHHVCNNKIHGLPINAARAALARAEGRSAPKAPPEK